MKLTIAVVIVLTIGLPAGAQRHKLAAINAETPEGKLLQTIGHETDDAKKRTLLEQFVTEHGKHEAVGWALSQLQDSYAKAGNYDKAMQAGERLIAIDGLDIGAAYASLKAAEAKKDSDAVVKWSALTSDIARKAAAAPKEADQSDEEHKNAIEFANQVQTYSEYVLYAAAITEQDPQKVMALTEALEQRNPKSQYIAPAMSRYAWGARAANAAPKAVAFGERAFERGQYNEDLLLIMADHYLQGNKSPDKVVLYANKIVDVLGAKPAPEGMAAADWERKKNSTLGLAYWMAGTTLQSQGKNPQADKALRAALPLIKDNEQLLAPALFHLGLANYQLGKGASAQQLADALRFMQQCAAVKGPYQARAQQNVAAMKKQMGAAR